MRLSSLLFLTSLSHLINSETILSSYITDYTLSVADSPYIVNSYVTFGSNANIIIENGVEIIFIDTFFISVFGGLNCGCNQAINNNIKGLSNNITYSHLFGNESIIKSPGIYINHINKNDNAPIIEFCNTIFENLQNGIQSTSNQYTAYTVKNCEFRYLNYGIQHRTNIINFVYNSYFHDVNDINSDGYLIYDNCLFKSFGEFSDKLLGADNVAIRNSEIYGNGVNDICLNINSITDDPDIAIYNNIISNCKYGIFIRNAINVRNNTITNCLSYGIYGININGDMDISYNSFNNNAIYDIMVNNSENIAIINNQFMSETRRPSAIYGGFCGNIDIQLNDFVSVAYENSMLFQNCGKVNVIKNEFINNNNKNGSIYSNRVGNMTISYNTFIANNGGYLIKIEDGINNYIKYNNIINTTISDHLIDIRDAQYIQIRFNIIMGNMHKINKSGELISIQNANYLFISNNGIKNNYANNSILSSKMNDNVYIQHNIFTQNGIHKDKPNHIKTNLIYYQQTMYTMIEYNMFKNSIDIENILYFSYLNKDDMVRITNNDFIETDNKTSSYIHANDGDITSKSLIQIYFNNFYNSNNVNYFISTNGINIDANNNYWSGLKTYKQIRDIIYDICHHGTNGLIHISPIMEQPIINDTGSHSHCFWSFINCNNITHYRCDSDTPLPTIQPLYVSPTANPTTDPSSKPSLKPSSKPSMSPITSSMDMTSNDSALRTAIIVLCVAIGNICIIGCLCLYYRQKINNISKEVAEFNKDDITSRSPKGTATISLSPPGFDSTTNSMSINTYIMRQIAVKKQRKEGEEGGEHNDLILYESDTAGNFEQIVGDNAMVLDLVMDDIVEEIETVE